MSKIRAKDKYKDIFKIGDIFILLLVLVLVVLTVVFALQKGADTAEIYIDGELCYTLALGENKTLEILDGKMKIVVEDGQIYVSESDCNEQLCVHASKLGSQGGVIVCLPNRVVIKVTSKEVDAIT